MIRFMSSKMRRSKFLQVFCLHTPKNFMRRSTFQVRKRIICLPMIDVMTLDGIRSVIVTLYITFTEVCDDLRKGSFSPDG